MFSFLTWLVWVGYNTVFHIHVDSYFPPLFQTVIAQGSGGFLVHNVPLWFVSCLLVVEFVYYLLSKHGHTVITAVVCLVLAILSFIMEESSSFFDFTLLPWSIGVAFSAIIFYAAGNAAVKSGLMIAAREISHKYTFLSGVALAVMTTILVLLAPLNGHVSMGHEQYNNRLLFYVNGFVGSFCVLLFSMLAERVFEIKWFSWIKWIGLNSLYFMLIENPIKGFVVVVICKTIHITEGALSQSFFWSSVAFVISLLITVIAVKCILAIKSRRKIPKDVDHPKVSPKAVNR